MRGRHALALLGAALFAGALGLLASVAVLGPGPLMSSAFGEHVVQPLVEALAPPAPGTVALGEPIGPMQLTGLDGRAQAMPALGMPVLINYWASWCGPCREEMPLLSAYSRTPGSVRVVGIALDTPADAEAFLARYPVSFSVLVEAPGPADSSVRLGNGRGVLPFSVLVSADGRLLKRRYGAFEDAAELRAWAQAAP